MIRSSRFAVLAALAILAAGCTPTGTPANCAYSVQLAQHPGVGPFHGAGAPSGGGSYSVDVIATPSTCPVPTSSSDPWITITQEVPDRGLTYQITAAANTGAARRTGTAHVGYQALTVDQAGTGGSGCTFQILPASTTHTTAAGLGAFVIVPSDQNCGWDADRSSSGEDWSGEPRPSRGVGTTGITFEIRSSSAAPQPPLPRQAEIRVRDSAAAPAGAHQYSQQ
jgi:hypothetical protein